MFYWYAREELVQPGGMYWLPWGLLWGTSGRKDLCIVEDHSGQSEAKSCGGCLKVMNWGWRCKSQKLALFIGRAGSRCVILMYCESLLQVVLGIYCKRFYWISFFTILLLVYVFARVWGWQSQKCSSKCPSETLNGLIPEKFSSSLHYPWKFIIFNPTPFPLCFFPL